MDRKKASQDGKRGAHTLWAKVEDRAAHTAPGRAAADARFEHQVDPEGVLPPKERAFRAAHARKAHMLLMAQRSVEARRAKGDAKGKTK